MDQETFQERVVALQDRLYRIACGQLRVEQDRQDAVQEALLKAWRYQGRLKTDAYFDTWLIRILINECHNQQRRSRRLVPMAQTPEFPEGPAESADLREAVWALPEKLRTPILLYYMEGYSTGEIARILPAPPGTVRSRLRQGRIRLRQLLEETDQEGSR